MTITQTGIKKGVQGVYIVKDPDAQIIYTIDWSSWLATGDYLSTSAFTVETVNANEDSDTSNIANLTIVSSGITSANTYSYVEVSGGTAEHVYTIKNTITTVNSITDVRRFRVKVDKRYL